jgi:hypothetical protein
MADKKLELSKEAWARFLSEAEEPLAPTDRGSDAASSEHTAPLHELLGRTRKKFADSAFCVLTDRDFANPLRFCCGAGVVQCSLWMPDDREVPCELFSSLVHREHSNASLSEDLSASLSPLAGMEEIVNTALDNSTDTKALQFNLRFTSTPPGEVLGIEVHKIPEGRLNSLPQLRAKLSCMKGRPAELSDHDSLLESHACIRVEGIEPICRFTIESESSLESQVVIAFRIAN